MMRRLDSCAGESGRHPPVCTSEMKDLLWLCHEYANNIAADYDVARAR